MRSLTRRGGTLVAVGVVSAGAGWGLGQPAVTAVALLLILVPLIGVMVVRRARFVLGSARTVTPTRIPYGTQGDVLLTVENGSRFTSGVLLLEDAVPEALGEPSRVLLDRIPPRAQRSERYPITGRQRGRTQVGPLTVRVTDPFGMASSARSFTSTNTVVVTPRVVPLGSPGANRTPGGQADTTYRAIAARGDDDLLPREHRAGDDMRRIHWRATARQGEIMVRREEQAWHSAMTVILDDRAPAHQGTGSASTFEWAVSAAASICLHYLRQGWRLTVVTTSGHVLVEARGAGTADLDGVLGAFADVRLANTAMANVGFDSDDATATVAVLGRLTEESALALTRPTAGFAGCLLLDPGPVGFLRSRGWRVTSWTRSTAVDQAWNQIAPAGSSLVAGVSR